MPGELANDRVHITADEPRFQLEGTEGGAGNFSLKEVAGYIRIRDETNNRALFTIKANQPTVVEIPILAIFEKPTGDLDASSAGVRFETETVIPSWTKNSATAAIEASWLASGTASTTEIELYDASSNEVITRVSGNEGTNKKSNYMSITEGHALKVRVHVTMAGGSADTITCRKAVVYERLNFA